MALAFSGLPECGAPFPIIGALPSVVVDHFQGRAREREHLRDLLTDPSIRIIGVCGRAGVGKTTLVHRVLRDLEDDARPTAVIHVSMHEPENRLADVLFELLLQVPGAAELRPRLRAETTVLGRLRLLTQEVPHLARSLLILDDLEHLLDEHNQVRASHGGTGQFLDAALEWAVGPRVVAISRRARVLSPALEGRYGARMAELTLSAGLDDDEAMGLLLALDRDGRIGARSAPEDQLRTLVRRCHGHPRTLETVAGTLRQRRTLTLARLVSDDAVLTALTADPSRELYHSLTAQQQSTLRALAVYDRPVSLEAVHAISPEIPVDALLEKLVGDYVVSFDADRFWLHPLDQRYAYSQISADRRPLYHVRAAAFWRTRRKPRDEWISLPDLDPLLCEYHQLERAGHYDEAAGVLDEMEEDHLSLWGHDRLLVELRSQLRGALTDPALRQVNEARLGIALRRLGETRRAIESLQSALDLARERGDHAAVPRLLSGLGTAWTERADLTRAAACYEEALAAARAIGDEVLEISQLGHLGNVYATSGRLTEAVAHHERAVRAARERGDLKREGLWLGNLANDWLLLGEGRRAVSCFEQALAIVRRLGDRHNECAWLSNLGSTWQVLGDMATSIRYHREALAAAEAIGDRKWIAHALRGLGGASHHLGDRAQARDFYERAIATGVPEIDAICAISLGILLLEEGRGQESVEALVSGVAASRDLLRSSPDLVGARYTLALGLLASGQSEEAVEAWRQAVDACAHRGVLDDSMCDLRLLRRAAPDLAGLEEVVQLIRDACPDIPSEPRATEPEPADPVGTLRDAAAAEQEPYELRIDERTGHVWERTRGEISFANKRVLGVLLSYLLRNAGKPCSTAQLLHDVWQSAEEGATELKAVRMGISRLRQLIEPDPANPRYVLNAPARFGHGGGYYFNPQARCCWIKS